MKTGAMGGVFPAFIASSRRRIYCPSDMLRFLSSLLMAMALFLSPLAMAGGAGMAMPHAAAPAAADHCAGTEAPADEDSPSFDVSCASSCAAYPPFAASPAEIPATAQFNRDLIKQQWLAGLHPERETPPPRAF